MLTLQEVESTARNYRFKYDYNAKTHTLINSATKQPLTDSAEIRKAEACILLNEVIIQSVTPIGGLHETNVTNLFFNNTKDVNIMKEMVFQSLINDIVKVVEDKQFVAHGSLGSYNTPIDFFIDHYKQATPHLQKCYGSLLNQIMQEKGIVVDDFNITSRTDKMSTSSFACSTYKISNQYTSNATQQPNNTSKKIASRKFVETLIEKYKQCEDDQNYEIRSNNEDGTMQRVVQVLDSSQPLTQIPNDFHKFMRMLISAQNLSISGERDFLKEIVMQDSVNQRLLEFENSKTIDKMDSIIAQKQSKQEKLGHKETRGEVGRRITNSCIEHNSEQFEQLKYAIQNGKSITFESSLEGDRFRRIAELYATTQGQFDMFKDAENSIT